MLKSAITATIALAFAPPAIAAPARPAPASHKTVVDHAALANQMCVADDAQFRVTYQLTKAARESFPALGQHLNADTKVVLSDATPASVQGYPKGYALKDGELWRAVCVGNVATRINGQIVEYRGLLYVITYLAGPATSELLIDRPQTAATFLEHLYINDKSLVPGEGTQDFGGKAVDEERELQAMRAGGAIAASNFSPSPEERTAWRTRQLDTLLAEPNATGR